MDAAAAKPRTDWALHAFETMAPAYDDFTAHYDYEGWLADLLEILGRRGLSGMRLLDVACGTGKSFLPMLPRGWQVTGCDISPAMLERASSKVGDLAELSIADMRELPSFGEFDLVWALDDAINYLLSAAELVDALRGMRENLAPSGLILFDVNELLVYRTFYAETSVVDNGGRPMIWRGQTSAEVKPGSICESRFEVQQGRDGDVELNQSATSVHRQKHFTEAEILAAFEQAGLECLDIYGHGFDGIPVKPLDIERHTKAIYIARQARG